MSWSTTHEDLDKKIRQLEGWIESTWRLTGTTRDDWEPVFALMKEIRADFNNKVKFPTRDERETAWQTFCSLRSEAHETSRRRNAERSDYRMIEINYELGEAYWNAFDDEIGDMITFYTAQTTKEIMKGKGRHLYQAGQLLSKYKHEMTREHKDEVFERIKEIREQHDIFWGRYREYQEDRQREFEQKRDNARERIEANLEKNREQLRKAEEALERQKDHRRDLEEQIASAWSDNFRDRAEGWLDEANDKIADIEASIERIEGWIEEGRDKLRTF